MNDFGSFLVERGAATRGQVLAARDAQKRTRPPIGRVALKARVLESAQVFGILAYQARNPSVRFGEAAIALGALDRHQVEELLRAQRAQTAPLEDLLIKAGVLDEATARALRRAFEAEHPAAPASIRPVVPRVNRSA